MNSINGEAIPNRPSKPRRPRRLKSPSRGSGWGDESARINPIFGTSKPNQSKLSEWFIVPNPAGSIPSIGDKINTGSAPSVSTSENENPPTSEPKEQITPTRVPTSENEQGVKEGWIEFGGEKQCLRIDAHALKWLFDTDGPHRPMKAPDKSVQLRGWTKLIWHFQGHTFVSNPKTLEIWTEAKGKKSKVPWTYPMLAEAWSKMDLARREWSKMQEVAIHPRPTAHPLDLASAHMVIKEKKILQEFRGAQVMAGKDYFKHMKGHFDAPTSARTGMTTDGSDPGWVEMNGPEAAEGAIGADHVFLEQPAIVRRIDFNASELAARYAGLEKALNEIQAQEAANTASQALIMRALEQLVKK